MLARRIAVLATAVAAGLAFATPAHAAESVDFGQKTIGESETKSVTIPLTAGAGEIGDAFADAIGDHSFGDVTIGSGESAVVVPESELKKVLVAAVGSLGDSTEFTFKIADLAIDGDSDFTVDDGCDNKDGQDTDSCTYNATFTATVEGARSADVVADISWTGGESDLTAAFAAAATEELDPPLSEVVNQNAATIIGLIDDQLAELLAEVYNPVGELKAVAVAPGGGGGGQTPTPGNGGGNGGGGQLPQTGVKVAQAAGGGLALVVLGLGILFFARSRNQTA